MRHRFFLAIKLFKFPNRHSCVHTFALLIERECLQRFYVVARGTIFKQYWSNVKAGNPRVTPKIIIYYTVTENMKSTEKFCIALYSTQWRYLENMQSFDICHLGNYFLFFSSSVEIVEKTNSIYTQVFDSVQIDLIIHSRRLPRLQW